MEFDSTADWFLVGQAEGGVPEFGAGLQALAAAGVRELEDRLGAAGSMHDASDWLLETATGARGAELQEDMVAAVIAADHYQAKVACPQRLVRRLQRGPWRQYAAVRSKRALSQFADAIVRWTVMDRIPVDWIVPEKVFAQMTLTLAGQGYGDVRLEGRLLSPFPGGAEWVRIESGPELAALQATGVGGVRAAVLYWPGCTTAAVLQDCPGGLNAHNPRLPGGQMKIQWKGPNVPAGVLLLDEPQPAPAGWFVAVCGRLHLRDLVWNCTRKWRLRRKR